MILVKTNLPDVLRRELGRSSWTRELVAARHRHRSVPADRGPLQAHAAVARGALRVGDAGGPGYEGPDGRARRRPADRRRRGVGLVHRVRQRSLGGRGRVAPPRAGHRLAVAALEGRASPGRCGCSRGCADGAARARHHDHQRVSGGDDPRRCRPRRALRGRERACTCRAARARTSSSFSVGSTRSSPRPTTSCTRADQVRATRSTRPRCRAWCAR